MAESTKSLVRDFIEMVNKGDWSKLDSLFAKDFVYHDASGETIEGLQKFKPILQGFSTAFPDLHGTIVNLIGEDAFCAVHLRWKGTNTGPLEAIGLGEGATGKIVELETVDLYRISDGKLAENWEFINYVRILEQLGLIG